MDPLVQNWTRCIHWFIRYFANREKSPFYFSAEGDEDEDEVEDEPDDVKFVLKIKDSCSVTLSSLSSLHLVSLFLFIYFKLFLFNWVLKPDSAF